jgi:hypothetical protein
MSSVQRLRVQWQSLEELKKFLCSIETFENEADIKDNPDDPIFNDKIIFERGFKIYANALFNLFNQNYLTPSFFRGRSIARS